MPGVDFNEVFSPVINDMTFRLAMVLMVVCGLDAMIFNLETAFPHGELKELTCMDCPEGMTHEDDECLLLVKSIHGLVQASNRHNEKFSDSLISHGFKRSVSDPCPFMRGEGDKRLIILTHVDGNLTLGKTKEIKRFLEEFESSEFAFTVEETLDDCLSCEVQVQ